MKVKMWLIAALTVASAASFSLAQAPAGSTGLCKDGTYTSAAKKEGACRGHKGVQTWLAATAAPAPAAAAAASPKPGPAPEVAAAPTPKPTPTPAAAPKPASAAVAPANSRKGPEAEAAVRPQAPGGGPGMVWVNTSTKVYHCPGGTFYGKTKDGKYMSEADAKTMGAHADHNKLCAK